MWTATSLPCIRRRANHLAFFPVPIYLKKARARRRTYNTKEALWTTDNSSCTQQQLHVFYTFTLLLFHLVRKFGFPACLCKLVNPHMSLPVGMHTLCRKTCRCMRIYKPACRSARKQYGVHAFRMKNQSKW